MFTAIIIVFLSIGHLRTSPNLFSFASPYQNIGDDNVLDDSLLDDVEHEGIEKSDLEDPPDDGKVKHGDEYSLAVEEPEDSLSQESAEPMGLNLPIMKEGGRKEKRWIWSKKSKEDNKDSWVFNTAPTGGARGTILPEDEHVRNHAAEVYGNEYDRGMGHVSRSNFV